jgi:hypothetical protein
VPTFQVIFNHLIFINKNFTHCQNTQINLVSGEEKNATLSPKTDNLSQLIFHAYKSIGYVSLFRDSENSPCRKMPTMLGRQNNKKGRNLLRPSGNR